MQWFECGVRYCIAGNDWLRFVCKNGNAEVCSRIHFALLLKKHASYAIKIKKYFSLNNI